MKPEYVALPIRITGGHIRGEEKIREMIAFHRELIKIHKTYQAFRTGALQMLLWEEHLLAYGRFLGEEQLVVVLNNKDELTEVTAPVWKAEVPVKGRMKRLIYSGEKDIQRNTRSI